MFRDENDQTARRSAIAKAKSAARQKPLNDSTWSSEKTSSSAEPSSSLVLGKRPPWVLFVPTIPVAISSSMEERGLKFFFNRFATAVSAFESSPYDIKSPSFLNAISLEAPLLDAVVSVGLAALSNITKDRSLLLASREKHMGTINSVRLAVGNPEQASPDKTFKLIVMLSLYEVCSNNVHPFVLAFGQLTGIFDRWSAALQIKLTHGRCTLTVWQP